MGLIIKPVTLFRNKVVSVVKSFAYFLFISASLTTLAFGADAGDRQLDFSSETQGEVQAVVNISRHKVTALESDGVLDFPITLDAPSTEPVIIGIATQLNARNDRATRGVDYYGSYQVVTIPPGETEGVFGVLLIADDEQESDETIHVRIISIENAVVDGSRWATGFIEDSSSNSPRPSLSFSALETRVIRGGDTQLRWNAIDVERCRSTANPSHPDWINDKLQASSSDGFDITNIQNDIEFTLSCRGTDGTLISKSLTVTTTRVPDNGNRSPFNTLSQFDDLTGSLNAAVYFAQSQVIPARSNARNRQPHLIANRKALLMIKPQLPDLNQVMTVTINDAGGRQVGNIQLKDPGQFPETAYFVDINADLENVDFSPEPGASVEIRTNSELGRLGDPADPFLAEKLRDNAQVMIRTANGAFSENMYFPIDNSFEGKVIDFRSTAQIATTVFYGENRSLIVEQGTEIIFKFVSGQWLHKDIAANNPLIYVDNAWTGELAAELVQPGMSISVDYGSQSGELSGVEVGGKSQLLIHTIDIGMLVEPRGDFIGFQNDAEAHREYFQTTPVSSMIISQYEPVHLREVILPDGMLLVVSSTTEGGTFAGDMRQLIGKELISHGIDNANYGLHVTGIGEQDHPYLVPQITAHNNRGRYTNGIQVHGFSGGNGMATLFEGYGNEFSHEIGHNYNLGHYIDGFAGSIHRSAEAPGSTWGWDADKKIFIPNFSQEISGKDRCIPANFNSGVEECQAPFQGRTFGRDAMAGGSPMAPSFNRYTLYTANSSRKIQQFLESKAVFSPDSPTGFLKWNATTRKMEPFVNSASNRSPERFGVPVTTLVGYYDPRGSISSYIYPALHGAYGFTYGDDSADLTTADCQLKVSTNNGVQLFGLSNVRLRSNVMNKFHVNVPEDSDPSLAVIQCNGNTLAERTITPVSTNLTYTVNGEL